MRRFTIMGFTEAELGFVLAALFIAVAVAAVRERDANAAGIAAQQSVADSLRDEIAAMSDSVEAMGDSLEVLEDKISTKVPQCWERGEQSAPIADLDVLGANRYAMNGDTLTIDGVRARLAAFIARAEQLDCRFVVRARPTSGIDAVQQSAAVWQLRRSSMSTIGRASRPRREAAEREAARREAAPRAGALSARTVRVRNVCLQHFAAHQHLPVPTDAELEALPGDMTLAQSVEWWRAAHRCAEPATAERAIPRSGLDLGRAVGIAAMVALALAITYGKAQ